MNWFVLLLIPVVVLPVVLLYGFSGCASFSADDSAPPAPSNLEATGQEGKIHLTWQDNSGGAANFWVGRLKPDGTWQDDFKILQTETSWDDTGLAEGESHTYRIKAFLNVLSSESNQETASALAWKKAFDNAGQAATSDVSYKGDCLVQRIDKALLTAKGPKVRVTIRGGTNVLLLDHVSISAAAPAGAGGNPWDSSPPVVSLGGASAIPANTPHTFGPVDFVLDNAMDVIVAFDINGGNTGGTRKVFTAGPSTAYDRDATAEAMTAVRSSTGYTAKPNAVYLVETIEVLS
jgi:hypothetical protein